MTTDHAPAEPSDCNDCSEGPRLPRHVRLATGELFWQQEDIRIAGRGLDFAWTRTYRSRPDGDAPHWDNAYNLKAESARGDINVFNGAGAANLYRPQPGGGYAARGVFAEGRLDSEQPVPNPVRGRWRMGVPFAGRASRTRAHRSDHRPQRKHTALRLRCHRRARGDHGHPRPRHPPPLRPRGPARHHHRLHRPPIVLPLHRRRRSRVGDVPACHWHPDRQRLPQRRDGHVHLLGTAPAHRHHRPSR